MTATQLPMVRVICSIIQGYRPCWKSARFTSGVKSLFKSERADIQYQTGTENIAADLHLNFGISSIHSDMWSVFFQHFGDPYFLPTCCCLWHTDLSAKSCLTLSCTSLWHSYGTQLFPYVALSCFRFRKRGGEDWWKRSWFWHKSSPLTVASEGGC